MSKVEHAVEGLHGDGDLRGPCLVLLLLGIRGIKPRRRAFSAHLETLVTAIGELLRSRTTRAPTGEHERLCVSGRQIKEIEATQAVSIQRVLDKTASPIEEGRGPAALIKQRCSCG